MIAKAFDPIPGIRSFAIMSESSRCEAGVVVEPGVAIVVTLILVHGPQ